MSDESNQKPEPLFTATGNTVLSLVPLRSNGTWALDCSGIGSFNKVDLLALDVEADDEFHTTTTYVADNVFEGAGACEREAIPACGYITRAVFFVHGQNGKVQVVEIRTPNRVVLPLGMEPAAVESWLTSRCFKVMRKTFQVVLVFGLALSSVAAPALDDGDDDEDDDFDSERVISVAYGLR